MKTFMTILLAGMVLTGTLLVVAGGESGPPAAHMDPLTGTSWGGATINGQPVLADAVLTADFTEGQMTGTASCNHYFTSYTVDEGRFSVGLTGSTMMACPEPIMAQEQAFLATLESVTSFQISDGQLILSHEAGHEVLRFTAA